MSVKLTLVFGVFRIPRPVAGASECAISRSSPVLTGRQVTSVIPYFAITARIIKRTEKLGFDCSAIQLITSASCSGTVTRYRNGCSGLDLPLFKSHHISFLMDSRWPLSGFILALLTTPIITQNGTIVNNKCKIILKLFVEHAIRAWSKINKIMTNGSIMASNEIENTRGNINTQPAGLTASSRRLEQNYQTHG